MKTLFAAVNSQYIHSNLAVWQLKACCEDACGSVLVREYNINQRQKWVFADILDVAPDVLCFSCYIWNIAYILRLSEDLRLALPQCHIVLGGPEVSFDSAQLLRQYPFIDAIFAGEGEQGIPLLLKKWNAGELSPWVPGLTVRDLDGGIRQGDYQTVAAFHALPSPFTLEMLEATRGKILYYEAARGCPFSCSYCLSQISHGVREKPLDRVKEELLFLESQGVPLLKFVDRTFNCNPKRAISLWEFAANELKTMRLHFEIGGDLLDEEQLRVLCRMPAERIQLEAGVQSTHLPTLQEVCRKTDLEKLKANSKQLLSFGNIHYHLDLIAGLPYESYDQFQQSFNEVYELQPHQLQLGFLKMLKGSKIRRQAEEFAYQYRRSPPYEVISNRFITPQELMRLTYVEETLERYYNSGRFLYSLPMLLLKFKAPFDFYETLGEALYQNGDLSRSVSAGAQFTMLLAFSKTYLTAEELLLFRQKLRLDYLLSGFRGKLPEGLESPALPSGIQECVSSFSASGGFEALGLVRPEGAKEQNKRFQFAYFPKNPLSSHADSEPVLILIDLSKKDSIYHRYTPFLIPQKYLVNGFTTAQA